jgi:SAM-dependent methyltransferase
MDEQTPIKSVAQAWADHFKSAAGTYRLPEGLPFLRKFIRSPFIQLIVQYAHPSPGSQILEAGCASGKFSLCFAMLGHRVTALDFSPRMLENVVELQRNVEREVGPLVITPRQGDLENLDLESSQFDLVFNEGVVEHWLEDHHRRNVLAAMARVTKPGGNVAIIVPNGYHPRMPYWIKNSPAFLSAPPMVLYHPALLQADLISIGLTDIFIDGIYAWRTIDQWPNGTLRRLAGGALQRLIPLPHPLRLKWGIHLIAIGRKP